MANDQKKAETNSIFCTGQEKENKGRAVRNSGRVEGRRRLHQGAAARPDHRKGVFLRPRPQLRPRVLVHLQGRHDEEVAVPLVLRHQRVC